MAQHHYSSEPERDGFEELLERYVKELPERAGALRAARQDEDAVEAESMLHQLAGSLGLYGYRPLEEQCRAQLNRLRNGEEFHAVAPAIDALLQDGAFPARFALAD